MLARNILLVVPATFVAACGGGGGGGVASTGDLPPDLRYQDPNPVYVVGVASTPNAPQFVGDLDRFEVTPSLPLGLTLDATTGVITGTPQTRSELSLHTVTGYLGSASVSTSVGTTVHPAAPQELAYPVAEATYTEGEEITPIEPAFVGEVDEWSVEPELPAGLTLDPTNGIIYGKPEGPITATTFVVTASNVTGGASFEISLTVLPRIPTNLAYATPVAVYLEGVVIEPNLPTVDGTVTLYETATALPLGLTLDPVSGAVSGTPLGNAPTSVYTIVASNAAGQTTTAISITVNPKPPTSLSYTDTNASYPAGVAIEPNLPIVGGYADTFTIHPPLPTGINLDPGTGVISGTPQIESPATFYTVTAANVSGSIQAGLSVTVVPGAPVGISYTQNPASYKLGNPITPNVPTVLGQVDAWSIQPELPNGLSLNTVTGEITGTPLQEAPFFNYRVRAQNEHGFTTEEVLLEVFAGELPRFAYLTSAVDNTVSTYSVTSFTGQLRHGGYVFAGVTPVDLAVVEPYVFCANYGSSDLTTYLRDPGHGRLTNTFWPNFLSGRPRALTAHQGSRFLYAVCETPQDGLYGFEVDPLTGLLTAVPGSPFAVGQQPLDAEFTGNGEFLCVTTGGNTLETFAVASDGSLTAVDSASIGSESIGIAIDPEDEYVYVSSSASNEVSGFFLAADGKLSPMFGSPVDLGAGGGLDPGEMRISPFRDYLFVACEDSGSVSRVEIDPLVGAMEAHGPTIPTGSRAEGLAIDPRGLYVWVLHTDLHAVSVLGHDLLGDLLPSQLMPRVRTRPEPSSMLVIGGEQAVMRTPLNLYAGMGNENAVYQYSIDPVDGHLDALDPPSVDAQVSPGGVVIHPHEDLAFALNLHSDSVSSYLIDPATGTLEVLGTGSGTSSTPWSSVIEPSGRYLFTAHSTNPGILRSFEIQANGSLTGTGISSTGNEPRTPAVDPTGRFIYVPNRGDGTISQYRIGTVTGFPNPLSPPTVSAGVEPVSIECDPSGRFAFCANAGGGLSRFSIDADTGHLTQVGTSETGPVPFEVEVHPSGRYVFVLNSAGPSISSYALDYFSGALTTVTTSQIVAGPYGLRIDPSGRFLYTSNRTSIDSIQAFRIQFNGQLIPGLLAESGDQPREVAIRVKIE